MRAALVTVFLGSLIGCGTSAADLFSGAGGAGGGGSESTRTGTNTGTNTGSSTGAHTGTSTNTNSGTSTNTNSGTSTNTNSGTSTNSGTQTGTNVGGAGSGTSSNDGPTTVTATTGSGVGGAGPVTTTGQGGMSGAGGGCGTSGGGTGCSDASKLVYVFALNGGIYTFDPPTKAFVHVADPHCSNGQPNSMAIDRNLVAWLNYIGGIYTFDLNNPQNGCQLAVNLPNGFKQCGMGFSSDDVCGTSETLFIDGIGGGGLAKVDTTNGTVTPIGTFSNDPKLSGQSCELTGTGDARLFGYFTTSPYVRVAEIDKTTSDALSDFVLTGVTPPSDWAFSFWGGDFYLYAAPGTNNTGNSSVIHYSPATGTVDPTYVADVGFQIIGAGVSTCAPTVIHGGG